MLQLPRDSGLYESRREHDACGIGAVAHISGGKSHSIFALHFLNGLRNMNDSAFTAEELFEKYIKEPVQIGSKQTPEFQVIRQSGHKGGDFVFYKQ